MTQTNDQQDPTLTATETKREFWRKRIARLLLVVGLVSAGLFYSQENSIKIVYLAPINTQFSSLRLNYESLEDPENSRGVALQLQPPKSRQVHEVQLATGRYRLAVEAKVVTDDGRERRIFEERKFNADGTDLQIRLRQLK